VDTSKFQTARLIPTTGIKGDQDQERRTTSAFLAVLLAVPEFAKVLLKNLGAPSGKLTTYIEPEFDTPTGKVRPDGLLVVERGAKTWTAFVEVKTGKNQLQAEQLNAYLDLCKSQSVDALWTISNEVLTLSGEHPTAGIDGRKLRKTALVHFSWMRILTEALMQKEHRGISDPDQAWILGELIRYLQTPASGALEFGDMGENWVAVRQGVMTGTLAANDKGAPAVVQNFESLMRFSAFRLSAKLGVEVHEVAPKLAKVDPKKHLASVTSGLISQGQLSGELKIPNTVSNLFVKADIRANQIIAWADVQAPTEGRATTRVNWLLRQLKGSSGEVRIETLVKRSPGAVKIGLLKEVSENPGLLVPDDDREIVAFRVATTTKMGSKRGDDSGSFIKSVLTAIEVTYSDIFEKLRPWAQKAPKIALDVSAPDESPFEPSPGDEPPTEAAQTL